MAPKSSAPLPTSLLEHEFLYLLDSRRFKADTHAPHACPRKYPDFGAVAQLGERLVRNEEVSGSIPLSSTKESAFLS